MTLSPRDIPNIYTLMPKHELKFPAYIYLAHFLFPLLFTSGVRGLDANILKQTFFGQNYFHQLRILKKVQVGCAPAIYYI